jgi:CRP-like cAMP-binding protein
VAIGIKISLNEKLYLRDPQATLLGQKLIKESIIQIATGGDMVGHQNLFNDGISTVTVTPIEDSTICFIGKDQMNWIISEVPSAASMFLRKLSHRLDLSENKITSLCQNNVRERVAEFLIYLKDNFGVEQDNRWRLNIQLTREEMASVIGIAPETLVRFLSELRSVGLIQREKKILYIANEDGLRSFSGLELPSRTNKIEFARAA